MALSPENITDLEKRSLPPASLAWGRFTSPRGASIRYASVAPSSAPQSTIVLLQGFRQSVEEYFEVMNDLLDRGHAVWTFDWCGQGGSQRYIAEHPQRVHSEGYHEQLETLHHFMQHVVRPAENAPVVMIAHSMGGHLALRYVKEYTPEIQSLVVTAPMLDMKTWGVPKKLTRLATSFMKSVGNAKGYVPTGGEWQPMVFEDNGLTSCRARFDINKSRLYRDNPHLRMGAPTNGWVNHTFRSTDLIQQPEYLATVKVPVLMQISGNDTIVETDAQYKALYRLLHVTPYYVPEAQHDIWREREELRAPWMEKLDNYLASFLNVKKPRPSKPVA